MFIKFLRSGFKLIAFSRSMIGLRYLCSINSETLQSGTNGVNGMNVQSHVEMEQLQECEHAMTGKIISATNVMASV